MNLHARFQLCRPGRRKKANKVDKNDATSNKMSDQETKYASF